ncbi:YqgE/AlgH family protein, partial [Brevundimonas diminuta ATCC 11568]
MADAEDGPSRDILLLGYAGRGEVQLEEELNENVWLTTDAPPAPKKGHHNKAQLEPHQGAPRHAPPPQDQQDRPG